MSPDGALLDGGGAGTIALWDISNPDRPRRVGDPMTPHGTTSSISTTFRPQNGLMATGGTDGMVYLWDIGNPARPRQLGPGMHDNLDAVSHLTFSTDGTLLAATGSEGDVVLWDMAPVYALRRDPVETACNIAARGLDREEWARDIPGLPYRDTCA
jgi:WD40 repeat protein